MPVLPDAWTPQDLAGHLDRQGIKLSARARPLLNRGVRTAAALSDDRPDHSATVFVYRCEDEAGAVDQAASMGAGAFSAGRFAIGTRGEATDRDRELLARIETVLSTPVGLQATAAVE
jgi:hypothetical protein